VQRVGQGGYELPWLHLNQADVPTSYDLSLSVSELKQMASTINATSPTSSSFSSSLSGSSSGTGPISDGSSSSSTPSSSSSGGASSSSIPSKTPAPSSVNKPTVRAVTGVHLPVTLTDFSLVVSISGTGCQKPKSHQRIADQLMITGRALAQPCIFMSHEHFFVSLHNFDLLHFTMIQTIFVYLLPLIWDNSTTAGNMTVPLILV
jgi:hypothetical protein